MSTERLNPGQWRIENREDGTWKFQARYRLDLKDILPTYIKRNAALAAIIYLIFLITVLVVAGSMTSWNLRTLLVWSPLYLSLAGLLLLIGWPFRFRNVSNIQWELDHKLRYNEGNRTITFQSTPKGKLKSELGNLYPLNSLKTLQVNGNGMRPGRAGLWFSGEASGECIISWPGFPEQEVFEIRDALLKLAGSQEAFTPDPLAQSAETKPDISFSFEYAGRLYQALSRVITISTILGPVILSFASTYVASAYGLLPNGSYAGALLLGLLFIFMTSALLVYKKLRALLTMHFTDKGAARFNSNSVALVQKTQTITLYYQDIQSLQPIYTRDYLSELRIQTSVQNVRIQSSSKEAILAEEEWKASQQRNPLTLDSEKRKKRQEIFGGTSLGKLYKELRIRRGSGSGQQSKPNC